jgi:hypothetical protein
MSTILTEIFSSGEAQNAISKKTREVGRISLPMDFVTLENPLEFTVKILPAPSFCRSTKKSVC